MKLKKPKKEEVKILVVDDENIVALYIKNTLEKYGYNVVGIAANSKEALQMVKESKPNLILMDVMIKGAKDGIETASEINEFADIPIIFLTAYSDNNSLERAKLVEPYGYLIKPFDNRELFTTIEMSLYKHSMEASIREREENLAITLNSIGDGVISTDEKGLVVRMNPSAEKLTGWSLDEAKGKPLSKIFNLIDASTRKPVSNPVEKVFESGNVIELSNNSILVSIDGAERNISGSTAAIKDLESNICGVVLVFSDVTESYKARLEIKESEEKFRQLVAKMEQGLAVHEVIYDKKGKVIDYKFLDVNESFTRQSGLKREDIIGKTVKEVLPGFENYWIEKYGQVALTGNSCEFENYCKELDRYYHVVAYRNCTDQFAVIVTDVTESRKAQNRISLMASLLELSPASIIVHDMEGKILFANKRSLEMHGYTEEEFSKLNLRDIETHKSSKFIEERINTIKIKGELSFEVDHVKKDGTVFPLLINTKTAMIDEKEVILSVSNDLTEKKLQDEVVRQKTEELDNYFTNALDLFCIATIDGYFIRLNKQWENILGYSPMELEGAKLIDFVHPDDLTSTLESLSILSSKIEVIEFINRLRAKDGTHKFIEWRAYPAGNRIYAAARDITDCKLAEDALQSNEEMFRSYVENAPEAIMVVDEKSNYVQINKAACDMTGYTRDELLKMHIMDVTYPEDFIKAQEHFKTVVEKGEATDEVRFVTKKGEVRYWSVKAVKLNNCRFLGFKTDITDMKLNEESIKLSESKFNRAFHASPVAMSIQEDQEKFWDVNDAFLRLTGYSREEILGHSGKELNLWNDSEQQKYVNDHFTKHETIRDFEFQFRRKDGSIGFGILSAEVININGKNAVLTAVLDITDRKLAEAALKESEEKYRTLVENLNDVVILVDNDNKILFVNKKFEDLLGYTLDEVIGKVGYEFLTEEKDRYKVLDAMKQRRERKSGQYEACFIKKNGDKINFLVNGSPVLDSNGNVVGAIGAMTDITDRKRVENQLMISEEKYRNLFDTMPNGYYRSTHEGRFVDANQAFIKMLGYENLEELKKLFIPTDVYVKTEERDEILKGNPQFISSVEKYRLKRKDGRIIWVEDNARYIKDENGDVIFNEGLCKDITDRKEAEDALRESEQLFNTLAQVSPVGIFRTQLDGYTTYVNPKWVELAGIPAHKAMGDGWLDAVHPEDREKIKKGWEIATSMNNVSVAEYRFLRPDGTIVWVMGQATPEFDSKNNVVGYVGTITDITERKHAEEALRESEERLRILAEKTGTIVYDKNLISHKVHIEGAIEEVLGYTRDELNNFDKLRLEDLIDEKEKNQYFENIKNIIKTPGNYSLNYKLKHNNGSYIYIEDNGIVLTDEFGNPVRMLGSMRDITLKKIAEDELRKLTYAVEQSQVSILITNKEGVIEYVNPKFCEVTGYSFDEAIGQNPRILKSGEWKSETYSGLWNDVTSGKSWNGILHNKKKNGELFWESAHISPIKDFNGNITHYIAVKEDITEKVKNEEQLARYREHLEEMVVERTMQINSQNEFLKSLIDTIPNPLFVKDSQGCYTDVNPAFEKFFGKKREEIIGKKIDYVLEGESLKSAMETDYQLMKEKGIMNYETYFTNCDGKKIAVLVYKASFGSHDGKPDGIVGLFFDISLRKEMEEKTIQALNREKELNEMKTNFISMASHEFRTPLTTILASSDLIEPQSCIRKCNWW
ncbi:MAG: PAS domain S-box protein [Bacteroidota bacterium]